MHPNHQPRAVLAAFLVLIAAALVFGIVRCGTDERAATSPLNVSAGMSHWQGFAGRAPTTGEAPAPAPDPIEHVTEAIESSQPAETVPPVERPQSFTADGDDAAAWACLAVLESGDGRDSANIYGIMSARAGSLSTDDQLAWARQIRDDYGSYLVGWPETARKCGLG